MKNIASTVSLGLLLGMMTTGPATAETVTSTKTTTYSGTVSEMNPESSTIMVTSESSPTPVSYSYSKETTFVDSTGKVVSSETIRNSPVTVEYVTEGDRKIVRRVVQTGPAVVVAPGMAAPATIQQKTTTHTETHKTN